MRLEHGCTGNGRNTVVFWQSSMAYVTKHTCIFHITWVEALLCIACACVSFSIHPVLLCSAFLHALHVCLLPSDMTWTTHRTGPSKAEHIQTWQRLRIFRFGKAQDISGPVPAMYIPETTAVLLTTHSKYEWHVLVLWLSRLCSLHSLAHNTLSA